jgi:hypothetical protein
LLWANAGALNPSAMRAETNIFFIILFLLNKFLLAPATLCTSA